MENVIIEEKGLNVFDAVQMLTCIIDAQINNCRLQYQTDWEKNHSLSPMNKDKKIQELESLKKAFLADYKNIDRQNAEINLKFSFETKVVSKQVAMSHN